MSKYTNIHQTTNKYLNVKIDKYSSDDKQIYNKFTQIQYIISSAQLDIILKAKIMMLIQIKVVHPRQVINGQEEKQKCCLK